MALQTKETILIVDNEKSIRTSIPILLKTEGYDVKLAADFSTAIDIYTLILSTLYFWILT